MACRICQEAFPKVIFGHAFGRCKEEGDSLGRVYKDMKEKVTGISDIPLTETEGPKCKRK